MRDTAAVAVDEADFFARLTHDGTILVRLRHGTRDPGQVTGYAVALAGDTTAAGEPIFHSGGKLAADLTLTRLRRRCQPDTTLAGSDRRSRQRQPNPAEVDLWAAQLITGAVDHLAAHPDDPAARGVRSRSRSAHRTATAWEGATGLRPPRRDPAQPAWLEAATRTRRPQRRPPPPR